MANRVQQAIDAGHIQSFPVGAIGAPSLDPNYMTVEEKTAAALEVLKGIEEFRRSAPWWRRWAYCIGSAIKDLQELA